MDSFIDPTLSYDSAEAGSLANWIRPDPLVPISVVAFLGSCPLLTLDEEEREGTAEGYEEGQTSQGIEIDQIEDRMQ